MNFKKMHFSKTIPVDYHNNVVFFCIIDANHDVRIKFLKIADALILVDERKGRVVTVRVL
jgi:hypothetical protein